MKQLQGRCDRTIAYNTPLLSEIRRPQFWNPNFIPLLTVQIGQCTDLLKLHVLLLPSLCNSCTSAITVRAVQLLLFRKQVHCTLRASVLFAQALHIVV